MNMLLILLTILFFLCTMHVNIALCGSYTISGFHESVHCKERVQYAMVAIALKDGRILQTTNFKLKAVIT